MFPNLRRDLVDILVGALTVWVPYLIYKIIF
jgi:hypothetical protein